MISPRQVVTSGWIPALVVWTVAAVALDRVAHVPVGSTLALTAWFGWAHTVPGTVLWRALDRRATGKAGRDRPLVEDLVLGSILGIIAGLAAYLLAVAGGLPRLVLAWPLLVLVPTVLTPAGRRLLARRQRVPTPPWWSWSMAAVVVYVIAWSAHGVWASEALTTARLQAPYLDEPYHLALVGEFRHHFPAETPYVSGTPLRYHWLVYPVMAAWSWGSGIAPVALVRVLAPATLSLVLLLGVAVAAARISGHRWAGVAAAASTVLLSPLDVMGWTRVASPWIANSWITYLSPTQVLASALCPLLIVLLVDILRGPASRVPTWVLTGVVMLAVAGAKSAMLPLVIGALCGTTLVMLIVSRRFVWRVAGLSAMSVGAFALATLIFYGRGSRAVSFGPLHLVDFAAHELGLAETGGTPSAVVSGTLAVAYALCFVVPLVGGIGLFVRGGWRRPVPWVLAGCWVTALGVVYLFRHPSFGELYFLRSATVPAVLFSSVGWARAAGRMTRATALTIAVAGLAGLAWAFVVPAITSDARPVASADTDTGRMVASFVVPLGLALGGVLLALVVFRVLVRHTPSLRDRTLLVAISVLLGMCLPASLATARAFTQDSPPRPLMGPTVIGPGGIRAAEWLRDHSNPDDLVATNAHTHLAGRAPWDHRQFWISGYTERRILVEGWAYIAPEAVGLPSTERNNRSAGPPFWDAARLRLNDEVFAHPTVADLTALHRRYGVDWLFVDKARGADLTGLAELADERLSVGDYAVFQLRDRS